MGTRITRAKAIRLKCLDCSNQQSKEVKLCPITDCSLWRYRQGSEERDDVYYKNLEDNAKKREEKDNAKQTRRKKDKGI